MALSRTRIVEAAASLLAEHGLAGLTMRRLAGDLGVQPGALYHHITSKQELLAAVGEHLLSAGRAQISCSDPARAAADIRTALLPTRDSAEVISFVYAYRPAALIALCDLHRAFQPDLPAPAARLAAQALVHHVLGAVAVEQNRAELLRAGLVGVEPGADEAFAFGVAALVLGLCAAPAGGG